MIASFVRSSDLCSAALVCRKWNDIFMPLLWGNPASHFGRENDAVYVALVRFKRTLVWARSITRESTHTLHFPPAQAEIYDGPRSGWLSDILHRLPNLQSLIVSHIPFFDYGALSTLARLSQPVIGQAMTGATYNLRLLDASNCINLTPQTLAAGLRLFPALIYLDLSGTPSARSSEVLTELNHNLDLQILKLQRLWLGDDELHLLSQAVGRNLRSLDIRTNRITDRGLRSLIASCMSSSSRPLQNRRMSPQRTGPKLQEILDGEQQDEYIWTKLTAGFASSTGLEGAPTNGLTHLYISGNQISVEGASDLLKCMNMRVVDVGNVVSDVIQSAPPRYELPESRLSMPGVEELIPVIEGNARKLAYLRINHAVVTEMIPLHDHNALELADTANIPHPENAVELDTNEQSLYELPDQPLVELQALPVFVELEGSPVPQSPATCNHHELRLAIDKLTMDTEDTPESVSAFTSTLDSSGGLFSPISPIAPLAPRALAPTPQQPVTIDGLLTIGDSEAPEVVISPGRVEGGNNLSVPGQRPHRRTYSGVLDEHDARLRYHQSQDHALLPGTLESLRTLVLTEVPPKSPTPTTAARIIAFIRECAEEERWAHLRASTSYQLPPGQNRHAAEKQFAQTLFPLRKVVLEMAPDRPDVASWHRPSFPTLMLSSTLDPDCETYLSAGKDDFSFFGAEECGQPDGDGLAHIPLAAFTEKMSVGMEEQDQFTGKGSSASRKPQVYDVLQEVSKFRKATKMKHEVALARGDTEHVEGYWSGIIEVVRPR